MKILTSPKNKLLIASALLLVLIAAAQLNGIDTSSAARWIIGACSVAGIGYWLHRSRRTVAAEAPPPMLQVIARTGLSQRCGIALVEADGKRFIVVHGDGFAEVTAAPVDAPALARRTPSRSRKSIRRIQKGAVR